MQKIKTNRSQSQQINQKKRHQTAIETHNRITAFEAHLVQTGAAKASALKLNDDLEDSPQLVKQQQKRTTPDVEENDKKKGVEGGGAVHGDDDVDGTIDPVEIKRFIALKTPMDTVNHVKMLGSFLPSVAVETKRTKEYLEKIRVGFCVPSRLCGNCCWKSSNISKFNSSGNWKKRIPVRSVNIDGGNFFWSKIGCRRNWKRNIWSRLCSRNWRGGQSRKGGLPSSEYSYVSKNGDW